MTTRTQILVKGIVQGVGFRPFIYSLARNRSLKGQVFNNSNGVLIDVEGNDVSIQTFIDEIKTNAPPLSFIESVEFQNLFDTADFQDFRIIESSSNGERFTPVSPDVSVCEDCLREMFDENNRRFLYPFINCTNCGPRFTIIKDIPYDREVTTMREFEMCDACRTEYENPLDRRFHAEPTACSDCGPNVWFISPQRRKDAKKNIQAIFQTRDALMKGEIVAIKGIGGFHLACDARNGKAVETLRERKGRIDKPFAVMVKDLETAKKLVEISDAEEEILSSKERPIVLLKKKPNDFLSKLIAPHNHYLGVMLPYSPLHHLLFDWSVSVPACNEGESPKIPDTLVMTSGNFTDEPIVKDNEEAVEKLATLADSFLLPAAGVA